MHTQMRSKALLTDRWVQFEQNVWADKGLREVVIDTLALWSVTSVWILSSVSFFNSWQLFSL